MAAAASVVAGAGLIVAVIALIDDSAPAARSGSTVVKMDLDYEPIYEERSCPDRVDRGPELRGAPRSPNVATDWTAVGSTSLSTSSPRSTRATAPRS